MVIYDGCTAGSGFLTTYVMMVLSNYSSALNHSSVMDSI